mgnify:CR=1 FL=1
MRKSGGMSVRFLFTACVIGRLPAIDMAVWVMLKDHENCDVNIPVPILVFLSFNFYFFEHCYCIHTAEILFYQVYWFTVPGLENPADQL